MNRVNRIVILFMVCSAPVLAQGKSSGKYDNPELGLAFSGVYGWDSKFAQGSGAWSDLATYREAALDATVVLQVRNNIYKTLEELRASLKREFAMGGQPGPDKMVFKEIVFSDVAMKKGLKLKGLEVEGFTVRLTEEGKKREHFMMVRTYFGKNRLFRVHCMARRSRQKRVRDRFEIAMASLICSGAAEAVADGTVFRSERGKYKIVVPAGFEMRLPAKGAVDMRFFHKRSRVTISVYGYKFRGDLIDHRDQMTGYYGDELEMDEDDVKAFGTDAFRAVLTRGDTTTQIIGIVKGGRAYRIQTAAKTKDAAEIERIHALFEKSIRFGGR